MRWSRKGALRRKSRRHRFKSGQGLGRVVATRRKIRTVVGSRRRFAGNREAERVTRDRKVSRRRLIVPNGREADIAQGGGAPKLRLSLFFAPISAVRHPFSRRRIGGTPSADRASDRQSQAVVARSYRAMRAVGS